VDKSEALSSFLVLWHPTALGGQRGARSDLRGSSKLLLDPLEARATSCKGVRWAHGHYTPTRKASSACIDDMARAGQPKPV
jgi:hypothetical protein